MADWRKDKITDKQLQFIQEMRLHSVFPLPDFVGTTKGEASDYIAKYVKMAYQDLWAIEHGYD